MKSGKILEIDNFQELSVKVDKLFRNNNKAVQEKFQKLESSIFQDFWAVHGLFCHYFRIIDYFLPKIFLKFTIPQVLSKSVEIPITV